ncbi:hypothetical protein D3H55_16940 [Bacillus salacetis]|uniref:DUF3955 domain-containing protein n=1 Tax=Bacillus salacetis TaxID=2315464 RepID=A0A3A1QV60_9BACI|nr:hypothetical protein D3H55_16940 [Bacillus salacetis]
MNHQTLLGKVLFWLGFLLFIFGFIFNSSVGIIEDGPEFFPTISIPAIIAGIILIVLSNFFKKRNRI